MNAAPGDVTVESPAGDPVEFTLSSTVPEDWDALAGSDPAADFFHSAAWTVALGEHLPHLQPLWLAGRQGGRLVAGLAAVRSRRDVGVGPWRLRLDRFESHLESAYGGPLVAGRLSEALRESLFLQTVDAYRQVRGTRCSVRHLSLNPRQEERFGGLLRRKTSWRRRPLTAAILDLEGGPEEVARSRMAKNKRNERNRGLRSGAEVFATREESLLDAYYCLYAAACRHWGKQAMPLGLLRDILAEPQERVFLTCVRLDGRVIGGHLNCQQGRGVVTWNGVTDPAYARSHFPSTLAIWGDIVESCRRSAGWLDLGSSGGIDSLVAFKKHCGAQERLRGWYVREPLLVRAALAARDLWRRARPGAAARFSRWHDGTPKR